MIRKHEARAMWMVRGPHQFLTVSAVLCLGLSAMALEAPQADLVVVGNIATMAARPHAGGMAIAGGRLVFVGGAGSARRLLRPGGRLIELEPGQMVLPGLIDSHVHMLEGGLFRKRCLLYDAKTKARVLEIIAECARSHPDPWLIGSGWAGTLFDERGPTASELDAVVHDRPAIFYDDDGHSAWVNSLALAAADIKTCKPVPPLKGGRIECGEGDKPGGTLREKAVKLVEDHVPPATTEQWLAGLQGAQSLLHSFGITMIQDANVTPRMLEIYHQAARSGLLTMKVVAAQATDPEKPASQVDELVQLRDRRAFGRFSAGTAKIFLDGALQARTAALLAPYEGGDDRGILIWAAGALAELASRLDREGFQMHMHVNGDQAVRSGLDALAAVRAANGPSDNRHHIAHLPLVAAADIPRFRELGVIANFQPFWMFADEWIKEGDAVRSIGRARARQLYPAHSIARTGVRIAAGSDWPVSKPNPFLAIQAGITRQSPEPPHGRPWIPSERVSREILLAAYTTVGAYVNHRERDAGSLEAGKAADFIIIDRNVFTIPPHRIGETRVLNTFVDGVEVYRYQPAPTARNSGLSTRPRFEAGPSSSGRAAERPFDVVHAMGGRVTVQVEQPLERRHDKRAVDGTSVLSTSCPPAHSAGSPPGTDAKRPTRPQWHYNHISDDILPALRKAGVSEDQIDQMLVRNPRAILEAR
jgi:predicted amidohydrolase YtcJ